jgi:hypothetical protein
MKKSIIILFIFLIAQSLVVAQSTDNSQPVKPTNFQKKITTIVSGKARSYYALSTVESSVINVEGPGTLVVNTRPQFNPGETGLKKYTVMYTIDGSIQKSEAISEVEPSTKASYEDAKLGIPGELRTFKIELLRGSHTIEFKLNDITCNVAVRYIFTPGKIKKQEWLVFSPVLPAEPVDLISKESSTDYYRFSMEKPLKVDIIGPTELRVLTRTENHFQMKGTINYRVQVKENGLVINTYQLHSKVSEAAVYKDDKELIPGTACEFVIYVPKGNHVYEIVPLDKDKNTLLGRLLIPVKDVKLVK